MNALTATNIVTMSSLEIVEYINAHRKEVTTIEKPYKELRHDHFMAKVPQVLGEKAAPIFLGTDIYTNGTGGNVQRQIYVFPKREACLMAMSYSYELQAQVFDRMTAMENHIAAQNLPSYAIDDPIERAKKWIEEEKQKQIALMERDHAIATKAEIGSKREATAMATASRYKREAEKLKVQLNESQDYASIKFVEIATGEKFGWHKIKKWCIENKYEIKTIPDPNFGSVKTYHKDSWLAVYGIDLLDFQI